MKILVLDPQGFALDFCVRAQADGHDIKWYVRDTPRHKYIGRGLISRIEDWQPHVRWADMVFLTDNTTHMQAMDDLRRRGVKVFGPTKETADWELQRTKGMDVFRRHGIPVADYREFSDYDRAIEYVKKTMKPYVSKPCGDESDKSLSYVAKNAADLVYMLQRWKKAKRHKGPFILQEKIDGVEMAVGGWFGPNGFNDGWHENWEFKRLMNGDMGPNCYSEDTEVLTQHGWRLFNQVSMNDLVASYRPDDGKIFYEYPGALHWRHYAGDMIQFRSRYVDLLVTPTHQMYAAQRKRNKWKFYDAENMPTEAAVLHAGITCADEIQSFALPEFKDGRGYMWPSLWIDADAWFQFMGIYLSEGSCYKNGIRVAQIPGAKRDQMRSMLRKLPFKFCECKNTFKIYSTQLAAYLRPFGTSLNKSVPLYIRHASARQIDLFLSAFCLGDGDIHNGKRRYHSGSREMIGNIQEMMLKIGKAGIIYTDSRAANPVYSIEETDRKQSIIRRRTPKGCTTETKRVHYDGMIGCVTLPTTHLLIVRRNGRAVISGNTGEQGTVLRVVRNSKLADMVLAPMEEDLADEGYVGYVDVNCIIDASGKPWPLEFTMRPGWPTFNIQQALQKGDVAEWMLDLCEGRDARNFRLNEVAVGVVMSIPDYPYSHVTRKDVVGVPLYGVTTEILPWLHPCEMMYDLVPKEIGGAIVEAPAWVSAGDYILVATGCEPTIEGAREKCYEVLKSIQMPNSPMWRSDVGEKLKRELPKIQKKGFAMGMVY